MNRAIRSFLAALALALLAGVASAEPVTYVLRTPGVV